MVAESAERADKLREATPNRLQIPYWCCILELVRTHFAAAGGEEVPPRKFGKVAEPHRSKPQKSPEKNIGSNHVLILGEENFLILMERLYIVRHGEINFNIEGRYAGSVNVGLNEKGLQQARDTANDVSNLKIDFIISSPLKRCRRMAEIIHEVTNAPIVVMDEFRERGVGVFEGLTREEAKNKYPDLWARNITRIYDDAPPNGETIKKVENRVFAGLNKVRKEYDGKNVLIVTHAFVGKMIHKFFHDMTEEQFFEYKLDNAKVVEYDFVK